MSALSLRLALLACSLATLSVQAQKNQLTLQATVAGAQAISPQRLEALQWAGSDDAISYVKRSDKEQYLVRCHWNGSDCDTIVVLSKLSSPSESGPVRSLSALAWINDRELSYQGADGSYLFNTVTATWQTEFSWPVEAEHHSINPTRSACAYVLANQLWFLSKGAEPVQLTADGGKGIVYGQSVHRNEFGITGGLFWSPNGERLAAYRMDERAVTEYPLVNYEATPASHEPIRYPMAGQGSHSVSVLLYENGKPLSEIERTGTDQYVCAVALTNRWVYAATLNRDQNHMVLKRYEPTTGAASELLEERHPKYVEPENAPYFNGLSDEAFIWQSERNGFNHLHLYKNISAGDAPTIYTSGMWECTEMIGTLPGGNQVLVQGTGEVVANGPKFDERKNGTQRYLYLIDLRNGGKLCIDTLSGTHRAVMSPSGKRAISYFTSLKTPLRISTIDLVTFEKHLLNNAPDPLLFHEHGSVELTSIAGPDGTTLYGRLIKPSFFNPKKSYPVLLYVYGGPHAQLVQNSWLAGASLWMLWMAEQGYIIATLDNRGSAHRGLEFEQETFRQLGTAEMEDQLHWVRHLKALPYTDDNRIAVHGWSFGGFMTTNLMLHQPGLFAAGVAGGAVCDWSLYEVMYTERYMDTPEANPEGYSRSNLIESAKNLSDDLLLIHGTADDVVLMQHSLRFVDACVKNKIQVDYFPYPGHAHNVIGPDRVHLIQKMFDYVDQRIGTPAKP